jgi:abelson tyrosine-protein kinase 1
MMGQNELTWQIDSYSFGICCIEILLKGGVPWPLNDDDAVRHFVLGKARSIFLFDNS